MMSNATNNNNSKKKRRMKINASNNGNLSFAGAKKK